MTKTMLVMLALAALTVVPTAAARPLDDVREDAEEIGGFLLGQRQCMDLSDDVPPLPPGSPEGVSRLYYGVFGHYCWAP